MSAPTMTRSVYPSTVENLLPHAQQLATDLGRTPSINRLKAEYRIGTDKARVLRNLVTPDIDTDQPAATTSTVGTPEHIDEHQPDPAAPAQSVATDETPTPAVSTLASPLTSTPEHTDAQPVPAVPSARRRVVVWPVVLLALPAFVAIWSGWVGLGGLTGFGVVHPLPGIADGFSINSAITLPVGVESYGAYALYVALSGRVPGRATRFAKWSAIASLLAGALGQVAYHLLDAAGVTAAPWWITTAVACLPVAVLGMGAARADLVRNAD